MSITHTVGITWSNGGTPLNQAVTGTGSGETDREITVAGNATNFQIDFSLTIARLQVLVILSDQTLTVKTNSSGSPDDTFTITANIPLVWYASCGLPNPFASTVNVTKLYATNAGSTSATLKIKCLANATS